MQKEKVSTSDFQPGPKSHGKLKNKRWRIRFIFKPFRLISSFAILYNEH